MISLISVMLDTITQLYAVDICNNENKKIKKKYEQTDGTIMLILNKYKRYN